MTPAKKKEDCRDPYLITGKCQEEDIKGSEALRGECKHVPKPELVIFKSKSSDGVWATKVHQKKWSPKRQEIIVVFMLRVAGALAGGDVSYGKVCHCICK